MPTHEFIITITSGTWNGVQLRKYSEQEANATIETIQTVFQVSYTLTKNTLIK